MDKNFVEQLKIVLREFHEAMLKREIETKCDVDYRFVSFMRWMDAQA